MRWPTIVIVSQLWVAAAVSQGTPQAEYQVNSAAVALSLNGQQGDAYVPASDIAWINGQASVLVEATGATGSIVILAYELDEIISRSMGAYVTPGGQIVNMPMGASFVSVDVTGLMSNGSFLLQIPTGQAASYAFQALVTDATHPDGFRLSAPAVLKVTTPTGVHLSGSVDLNDLSLHQITVTKAEGLVLSDEVDQVGELTYSVSGTVALTSPSIGTISQQVTLDGVSMEMLFNGVPVSHLGDLFPVVHNEAGVLQMDFDAPVSIAVSGMYLAPPLGATWKTDRGVVIPAYSPYPVPPGFPPVPTYTSAEAAQIINSKQAGLAASVTEVSAPSPDSWCHGYTFLPPGTNKGIDGRAVPRILHDNNYRALTIPPETMSVGDVAIYTDGAGNVLHSGVVTGTNPQGAATEITSKWGALGVYKHAPEDVLPSYKPTGGQLRYYRSPRYPLHGNSLKDP